MKILIIRHGEPDYIRDSLTEKGRREAECLADMLCAKLPGAADAGTQAAAAAGAAQTAVTRAAAPASGAPGTAKDAPTAAPDGPRAHFYTSPYGRAKDTAAATLNRLGQTAQELPWLKEFDQKIKRPDKLFKKIPWDWLPQDWMSDPRFYDRDRWSENERMAAGGIGREFREVTEQFDALLASHGYRREGGYYRVENANHDTIVLFCHFGLECVLLSHIFGVSPMTFWHHSCAAPSSVTTLVSEERRKGIAVFRILSFGDTSHLYAQGIEPSFAARFCECYDDDTRHD